LSGEGIFRHLAASKEGGNVTLELALALPFLLLVLAGTVDLGFLFWEKQVLITASREGARAAARAAVTGAAEKSSSQVQQVAQDYLDRFHLKVPGGANLSLSLGNNFFYTWDLAANPRQVRVELRNISVPLLLLPQARALYHGESGAVVNLSAATTMAAEWSTPPP
jgi:Flp pilus assembly protein TadG